MRTLTAIHLASALAARSAIPDLVLLSLDERVRGVATRLQFSVLPSVSAKGSTGGRTK